MIIMERSLQQEDLSFLQFAAAVSTNGAGVFEGGNQTLSKQSWKAKLQVTRHICRFDVK